MPYTVFGGVFDGCGPRGTARRLLEVSEAAAIAPAGGGAATRAVVPSVEVGRALDRGSGTANDSAFRTTPPPAPDGRRLARLRRRPSDGMSCCRPVPARSGQLGDAQPVHRSMTGSVTLPPTSPAPRTWAMTTWLSGATAPLRAAPPPPEPSARPLRRQEACAGSRRVGRRRGGGWSGCPQFQRCRLHVVPRPPDRWPAMPSARGGARCGAFRPRLLFM